MLLLCRQSRVSGPLSKGHSKFFLQGFPGACQKSVSLPKAPSLQPSPDFSAFTAYLSPCSLQLQPSREAESRAWLSRCCQSHSCSPGYCHSRSDSHTGGPDLLPPWPLSGWGPLPCPLPAPYDRLRGRRANQVKKTRELRSMTESRK